MNLNARLRTCLALAGLGLASVAAAKPEFWEVFQKHYRPPASIVKAECATCHVTDSMPRRNPFGRQVQQQLGTADLVTVAMLAAVEAQDADADSVANVDEIRAGTLPGDPKSRSVGGTSQATTAARPLVPTHSFHPLLVHFPIGIYLFGVLLDLWGGWRRSREIRLAGKFALVVGALASLVAVGTGLLAMFRMGIAIEGAMLNHLVSGAASALLGLVVAIWRSKKEVVGFAYWTVLLLSGVLMALAGHLGAEMVWG